MRRLRSSLKRKLSLALSVSRKISDSYFTIVAIIIDLLV